MYKPNTSPNPQLRSQQPVNDPISKCRKVIISRQLLENGQIIFILGTKFDGVVNRDPDEVPLSKILDHVTSAELQRYENQNYLSKEILAERIRVPKPRGRPPKSSGVNYGVGKGKQSTHPSQRCQPSVVIPVFSPVSKPSIVDASAVPTSPKAVTKIASPNSPRMTRKPHYSMLAASGLAPSETSNEDVSRNTSVPRSESLDPIALDREPSPKRRKITKFEIIPEISTSPSRQLLGYSNDSNSPMLPPPRKFPVGSFDRDESHSNPTSGSNSENTEPVDTIDLMEEDAERQSLLRQFQNGNIIRTSTSDQMKANSQAQLSPIFTPTVAATTPGKPIVKRRSLTPCFPPAAKRNPRFFGNSSSNNKEFSSTSPEGDTKMPSVSHPTQNISRESNRPVRSERKASELFKIPPVDKQNGSSLNSRLTPQNLKTFAPTTDITAYFRPKEEATPKKLPPPIASTEESEDTSDNESEDPLTRASTSSDPTPKPPPIQQPHSRPSFPTPTPMDIDPAQNSGDDSLNHEPILVQQRNQQNNPSVATNPPPKAKPREIPDSEDEVPHRRPQPAHPASLRPRTLTKAEDFNDDDDDDSSETDSTDSDVMIIEGP